MSFLQRTYLCLLVLLCLLTTAGAQQRHITQRKADVEAGFTYQEGIYLVSNYSCPNKLYTESLSVEELLEQRYEGFYFYLRQDTLTHRVLLRNPDGSFSPFQHALKAIKQSLDRNENKLMTLFLDFNVEIDIAQLFEESGLNEYLYKYESEDAWPTLKEMYDTGKRLVVFETQDHVGSPPWIHGMKEHVIHSDPEWGGYNPLPETQEEKLKRQLTIFTGYKHIEAMSLMGSDLYDIARHTTYLIDIYKNSWIGEGRIPNFVVVDRYGAWVDIVFSTIRNFNLVYGNVTGGNTDVMSYVNWEGMSNATTGAYCFPIEADTELMLAPTSPGYNIEPEKRYATGNERRVYLGLFKATPKPLEEGLEVSIPFNGDAGDRSRNHFSLEHENLDFGLEMARGTFALFANRTKINLPPASKVHLREHDFTVQAWVKIPKYLPDKGDYCILGSKSSVYQQALHLLIRNRKPYMGFFNNDLQGNTTIEPNTWYHIVWRYNKSNGEQAIFVNGKLDAIATGRPSYLGSDSLYVGFTNFSQTSYFVGQMDDLAIWSRPLSGKEILGLSNQLVEIQAIPHNTWGGKTGWIAAAALVVGCVGAVYGVRKRVLRPLGGHLRKRHEAKGAEATESNEPESNKIFFYGPFTVIDKDGEDITALFTPKLKQLFILLFIHSTRGNTGISGSDLSERIWGEDNKNVKRVRSVSILKLRKILERMDKVEILFTANKYVMMFSGQVYCDYMESLKFLDGKTDTGNRREFERFYGIIERGEVFKDNSFSWLDDTKSHICNNIVDILCGVITTYSVEEQGETIIHIADQIFINDPCSEEALVCKVKALSRQNNFKQARYTYEKFCSEYQSMYGEAYKRTFQEVESCGN